MFWQQKIKVLDLNPGKMQWKIVCELKRRPGVLVQEIKEIPRGMAKKNC